LMGQIEQYRNQPCRAMIFAFLNIKPAYLHFLQRNNTLPLKHS